MSVPSEPQIYIRPGVWDSNIQLYWQPPLDNGGSNILSYTIQCQDISLNLILPPTDRSTIVANLINGVDHTFTIYASNEFGNSNVATYRTVEPGTEPDDPSNINCIMKVPGNLLLSWTNPVFTGNANLINSLITMTPIDFRGNILNNSNVGFIKGLKPEPNSRIVLFPNTNYSYRALVQSINDSEYSSYENLSPPFNPLIPSEGLKLWLDACDRSTITLSGNNVIRWNDKSFNRSNANVALSFAPIYDTANALIVFNGSQYLNLPSNTLPSSNLPYSMFMYVSTSNININGQWFLYSGTPAGNSSLGGYFNSSNIFHSWGNFQSLSNNTSTANAEVLLEYLYDGSTLRTYLDGTLILTDLSNVKNSTSANNIIGSNSTINGNLRGSIGEILVYDRNVSEIERLSIENYMINKKRMVSLFSFGNLLVWLDASDTNTLYDNQVRHKAGANSNVFTWVNESESGVNVLPANISLLPFNRPSQLNNLTTLEFNRSFLTSTSAGYPTDAYIIVQLANLANVYDIIGIGNANIYNSLSYGLVTANRFMNASNDSTRNFISTSDETSNGYVMLEWTIANSNTYIRRFGDELVYDNRLNWAAPNNLVYYIGEGNTVDIANALVGNIGEIIIFNRQLMYNERRQVEGYLANKWGLTSSLSNVHPFKNTPPSYFNVFTREAPIRFSPNIYPNLLYWIDATDAGSYTSNSNIITSVRDKSSSNLITTITGFPTRKVNIVNGLTTFGLNNSVNNFDSFNATLSNIVGTSNYAFATVWRQTSNANATVISMDPVNLSYASSAFLNIRDGNVQASSFNAPHNNFYMQIGMRYGNTLVNYFNSNSTIAVSNLTISNVSANIIIGKTWSNTQPVVGDIAEAMVFRELTQEQRITLEGYFAWKYQLLLPLNHPYYFPILTESYSQSGFIMRLYRQGYFADNVNWFASYNPTDSFTGITNMTNLGTATNNIMPVNGGDYYSVQWTGYFLCKVSGTHTFWIASDDASYCWIGQNAITGFSGSNFVTAQPGLHPVTTGSGTINLTAGIYYPIRIQFGEAGGGDDLQFSFQEPGGSRTYNFSTYAFNAGASNFS
jgi:hypothetical protein